MNLFLISLGILFAATPTSNVTSWKSYKDTPHQFKIDYPLKWKVEPPKHKSKSPVLVTFAKPDQTILVTILFSANEGKLSAQDFLKQLDQSRKATNRIPEKQRKIGDEILKKSGASEAAIGYYEIPGKSPVLQRALALKRNDEIFVLTGTFQKAKEGDDDPLVEAALTSFQFNEPEKTPEK